MAKKYWTCITCKARFKRQTVLQRVCPVCRELKKEQEALRSKITWKQGEYKKIQKAVFNRDENCCKICQKTEKLVMHHWNKNHSDNSFNNLATLCVSCHTLLHRRVYPK